MDGIVQEGSTKETKPMVSPLSQWLKMNRNNENIEDIPLDQMQSQISKLGAKIHKGYFKSQ
jgi:hypothetical protein